jgi:hypothetical protein
MAKAKKAKKGSKENPIAIGLLDAAIINLFPGRSFKIIEASLKDMYCDYTYQIISGVGVNNKHKVPGEHVVLEDMTNAFNNFNVHLAALDGAFKLAGVDIDDINKFESHEITLGFRVSGFKIKGNEENESICLIGSKYSAVAQGWFGLVTPFIPINGLSFYKWYNELKAAANTAREEVALYEEGKYLVDDKEDDVKQLRIDSPEAAAVNPEGENTGHDLIEEDFQDEFEKAKA